MSEDEILKAARHCPTEEEELCDGCPLFGYPKSFCALKFARYIFTDKENEPAPAEAEPSSKENNLHLADNTSRRICQAVKLAERAGGAILDMYENMGVSEQKAFDIGEIYRDVLSLIGELEDLKNGDGE